MTFYTIIDRNGGVLARQMTLADAAITVMQYDGFEFDIRRELAGDGFRLWTSRHSRNSPTGARLLESRIYSMEDDEDAARLDIYRQVIARAHWFNGQEVMTDDQYDAMIAESEIIAARY